MNAIKECYPDLSVWGRLEPPGRRGKSNLNPATRLRVTFSILFHPGYFLHSTLEYIHNTPNPTADDVQVIQKAQAQLAVSAPTVPFMHVHHPYANNPAENGYFKLAAHFKWALNEVRNGGRGNLFSLFALSVRM